MAKKNGVAGIAAELKRKSNLAKNGEVIMAEQDQTVAEDQTAAGIEAAAAADDAAAESAGSEAAGDDDDDEDDDDEGPIPGKEPKAYLKMEDAYGVTRDLLEAAIAAGDLRTAGWKAVVVGKRKDPKAEYGLYEKVEGITETGALLLSKGLVIGAPEPGKKRFTKGLWDFFNYGFDLEQKRPLRREILKLIAGPEKEINKLVEMMVSNKMLNFATNAPYTKDEAKAAIIASRAAAGMTV